MRRSVPTPEQVREILLSDESGLTLAKKIDCRRQVIYDIRCGRAYRDLFPEIERSVDKNCRRCAHWNHQRCGLGFPDVIRSGPAFARLCSAYVLSEQ